MEFETSDRTCLDVIQTVTTKQERAASNWGGSFFWPDDILTESISFVYCLQEVVKDEARKDKNPWKYVYYHGYMALSGVKIYLRRQLLEKHSR